MRLVVTGAAGKLGTGTIKRLAAARHEIIGVDTNVEGIDKDAVCKRVQCSTTDYDKLYGIMKESRPEAIIHLVAVSSVFHHLAQQEVFKINTTSVYNILACAEELEINKIVIASSINTIGAILSKVQRFKYFPIDEEHPLEPEDSYSLSKQVAENIASAFARRNPAMAISSLRFHAILDDKSQAIKQAEKMGDDISKDLWGYVDTDSAIDAVTKSLDVTWTGHKPFFIVAPDNAVSQPASELHLKYWPDVPVKTPLVGDQGFFNCERAKLWLDWEHK